MKILSSSAATSRGQSWQVFFITLKSLSSVIAEMIRQSRVRATKFHLCLSYRMSLETAWCCALPAEVGTDCPAHSPYGAAPLPDPAPGPPRPQSSRDMEPHLSFRGRRALVTGAGKGDRRRKPGGGGQAGPSLTPSPRRDRSCRGRGAEQGRGSRDRAEPNGGGLGEPRAGGTGPLLLPPFPPQQPRSGAPGSPRPTAAALAAVPGHRDPLRGPGGLGGCGGGGGRGGAVPAAG